MGLKERLSEALDEQVVALRPIGGGDINDAYEAVFGSGRSVFVKTHASGPDGMFEAEAQGLAWLTEANALRVPEVLAHSNGEQGQGGFLVLEMLVSSPSRPGFQEETGRGLAALHRYGAPSFGFEHSNFIGSLSQTNKRAECWAEFYRQERIEPMVARAQARGLFSSSDLDDFQRLYQRLDNLVGPEEPPARLHGDLWSGNLHTGPQGEPCLIDPAVYGGHREMDLAMMKLFGGFGSRCFAAYEEAYPLAPGSPERVDLYQIYPLLVHVNLFGGGYVGSTMRAVRRYL